MTLNAHRARTSLPPTFLLTSPISSLSLPLYLFPPLYLFASLVNVLSNALFTFIFIFIIIFFFIPFSSTLYFTLSSIILYFQSCNFIIIILFLAVLPLQGWKVAANDLIYPQLNESSTKILWTITHVNAIRNLWEKDRKWKEDMCKRFLVYYISIISSYAYTHTSTNTNIYVYLYVLPIDRGVCNVRRNIALWYLVSSYNN